MSDKSDNSNLNEKYLEELREFYILKKRYEKYKENIKKKLLILIIQCKLKNNF